MMSAINDVVFSIRDGDRPLGTCFLVNVNRRRLLITCKHVFDDIDSFDQKIYWVVNSRFTTEASVIDFSNDIVVLIPLDDVPEGLSFFTQPFIKDYEASLGMYGYAKKDKVLKRPCFF